MIKDLIKFLGKLFTVILIVVILWNIYDIRMNMINNQEIIGKESGLTNQILLNIYKQLNNLKIENKLLNYEIRGVENDVPNKIENKLKQIKLNQEELEQKMVNGSVIVYSIRQLGIGSGTVIKKTKNEMYILTCYHVIADFYTEKDVLPTEKITIAYDTLVYPVDIIKIDKEQDLALLKAYVNDENLEVIKLAENNPKQGDTVYTVGNPLGVTRNISKGILSSYLEGEDYNKVFRKFYIVDALCVFGNSGGGLYNENAELIGIPSNVPSYGLGSVVTNMGMCISLDVIKEFLKDVE